VEQVGSRGGWAGSFGALTDAKGALGTRFVWVWVVGGVVGGGGVLGVVVSCGAGCWAVTH